MQQSVSFSLRNVVVPAFVSLMLVLALTVGVAASANAEVIKPPAKSPVVVAGTGLKQGEKLTGTQVLLRHLVTLKANQKKSYTFKCPGKTVARGLAMFDKSSVGFGVAKGQTNYPGKKTVKITARPMEKGKAVSGSIFLLCS